MPLGEVLKSDGTLDLPDGFRESLDARCWQLVGGMDEAPRFAQMAPAAEGLWVDYFNPPDTNNHVYALAVDGSGDLYAGGHFTTTGGVSAHHIARWEGSSWSSLGQDSGMNDFGLRLAVDGAGNLYAGGAFTTAGRVSVNRIAVWDGSRWSALGSGMDRGDFTGVHALAVDGAGDLYAGGHFTTAGGWPSAYIALWLKTYHVVLPLVVK